MEKKYTANETAEVLGIAHRSLTRLAKTNIVPNGISGRQTLYDANAVEELRARPPQPGNAGGALVVRLAEPRYDGAEGRWIGWNEDWEPAIKREAARKYWQVPDPDELIDCALVAAVAGWTVGVWRIAGYKRYPGGIYEFEVGDASPRMLADWGSRHLKIPRGPVRFVMQGQPYSDL